MQWTIDPQQVASGEVCDKAIVLFEARPRVIVRTSRRGFRIPSWTKRPEDLEPADRWERWCRVCRTSHNGLWYHQIVVADPNHETETVVLKPTCDCPHGLAAKPGSLPCHHAYGAALELHRLEFPDYRIVAEHPKPGPPRKTRRGRPLTVIPGGLT
jgi:hypothetical protein